MSGVRIEGGLTAHARAEAAAQVRQETRRVAAAARENGWPLEEALDLLERRGIEAALAAIIPPTLETIAERAFASPQWSGRSGSPAPRSEVP